MVFLIDLLRLDHPASTHASAARNHAPTRFYTELVYFLQATGVGEKMVASLANYDFSRTADIAFVHTMYVSLRYVFLFWATAVEPDPSPPLDNRLEMIQLILIF